MPELPTKRLALAAGTLLLSLGLGAAGLEGYARHQDLDLLQMQGLVEQRRRAMQELAILAPPPGWEVPYMPEGVALDGERFESIWGSCDLDSDLPTVLIFGDSTTRQASGQGAHNEPRAEARATWAGRLQQALEGRAQVCVFAEVGYHPANYAAAADVLIPALDPALVVTLLCANDIRRYTPRVIVPSPRDGFSKVYEEPDTAIIFPPMWQPWLYEQSEAFRFLHWRLALATGDTYEIERDVDVRDWDAELDALRAQAETQLYFVPPLDDPEPQEVRAIRDLARARDDVTTVPLSPPWIPLRRDPTDRVHLSDEGHAQVADFVLPRVEAALFGE